MGLEYADIGKRIREARLEAGISQEKLAELTGLSSQHISHIEGATTKLSLPALVGIANALDTTADRLLADVIYKSGEYMREELATVIRDCSDEELYIIANIAQTTKEQLRTAARRQKR